MHENVYEATNKRLLPIDLHSNETCISNQRYIGWLLSQENEDIKYVTVYDEKARQKRDDE